MPHDPSAAAGPGNAPGLHPECCGEAMSFVGGPPGGAPRFVCDLCGLRVELLPPDTLLVETDPTLPTSHAAGSAGKQEVMAARAAIQLPLFHPGDNLRLAHAPDARQAARGLDKPAGITWDAARQGYSVRVTVDGRRVFVGLFADEATAKRAATLARAGDLAAAKALARRHRAARDLQRDEQPPAARDTQ